MMEINRIQSDYTFNYTNIKIARRKYSSTILPQFVAENLFTFIQTNLNNFNRSKFHQVRSMN